MTTTQLQILGPDGKPASEWLGKSGDQDDLGGLRRQYVERTFQEFMRNVLTTSSESSASRSARAFKTHAWVYACAMAIAVQFGQAPFQIYQETADELARRREAVRRSGRPWLGPRAAEKRTAVPKHLRSTARLNGLKMRGAEPFYDHPLSSVLNRPNESMTGRELWFGTALLMSMRGEAFWHVLTPDGLPYMPGDEIAQIKLYSPDWISPLFDGVDLVGWRVNPPRGSGSRSSFVLTAAELVQFKYWNPDDPVRGLSPITAAASSIEIDLLSQKHTRAVLVNNATPRGLLVERNVKGGATMSREERREAMEWFRQRYQGVDTAGSTLALPGDFDYVRLSLTPEDMEWAESRRWGREEIAAVMRVPKSVLSITDDLNYAVQISQDRNFWRNGILPLMGILEDRVDCTLFYPETDNVFGGFDLAGVEALRAGLGDAVTTADRLCGSNLHMPPSVAFELVGLDVPDYAGADDALVNPLLARASDVLSGAFQTPAASAPDQSQSAPDPGAHDTPSAPVGDGSASDQTVGRRSKSEVMIQRAARHWRSLISSVEEPGERLFTRAWRTWVELQRRKQLKHFDESTKDKSWSDRSEAVLRSVDPDRIVLDLQSMKNDLSSAVAPVYPAMLDLTFAFTTSVDLGGVAVFQLDDPRIMEVLTRRQSVLLGTAPVTLQRNMRESLRAGIEAGETIAELRHRIASVYDIAASSHKTLSIARTESAGFMNASRDKMFEIVGSDESDWTTADDEHVRESHVLYGSSGPQKRGFNYLTLHPTSGSGVLQYPNDDRAPAGEVVNCRCCHVMVK